MNRSLSDEIDQRSRGWLGMTVAALAVLAAVVAALLVPVPFQGRVATAVGDLVHAPLFGAVTLGMLAMLQRLRPIRGIGFALAMRCGLVFVGMFAFGVLTEWLQSSRSRDASLHDAIADGLGVLAAVCWYVARSLQRRQPDHALLRRALFVNCGFLLAIAWWGPLMMLRDVAAMHLDFPLLASFESRAELERLYFRECQGRLTRDGVTAGDRALEITYQPTSYPGATLIELKPDWSRMISLEMDVTLDASGIDDVRFMVKVIDHLAESDHSDTFRREWVLEPGKPQHIRIERRELIDGPDTRELDLSQIQFVDMLVLEPDQSVTLTVDAIRLTID